MNTSSFMTLQRLLRLPVKVAGSQEADRVNTKGRCIGDWVGHHEDEGQ